MDPSITFVLLCDAVAEGDTEAYEEHLENLMNWQLRGGWMPRPIPAMSPALTGV